MNLKPSDFDYDIALSFAGEDRPIAQAIAEKLIDKKFRVFYDEFEEGNLWGKNLYDHMADVYSKRAAFCLMLISVHYAEKAWTNHERRHAQARAFGENREYILPVRLDDTQIPGIESTIAYVDFRKSSVERIAGLLEVKLSSFWSDGRAVRRRGLVSDDAIVGLDLSGIAISIFAEKEDGWECGLFLEVLREEMESTRGTKLDLQYGVVGGVAKRFEIPEFFKWTAAHLELLRRQTEAFKRLSQEGLQVVLGPEEIEGNPASICLVARKIGSLYKWAADWGMEFRSVLVNDDFTHLLNMYANCALLLMEGIDGLYREVKTSFEQWHSLDEEGRNTHKAHVEVVLPSPNAEEISNEIERLRRIYCW